MFNLKKIAMHGNQRLKITIIIAIYNRKEELQELLYSLIKQTDKNFEIIVVDDGSEKKLETIVSSYANELDIKYFYKNNSGAGLSRNYGARHASGNYYIFLDSDCIVPTNYIENVRNELKRNYVDAWGGADSADKNFTDLQKAISYSMTSLFTTGGIRGNKKSVNKFQPRSFNMGISKEAFDDVKGFSELRVGEDPDLSLALWEKGYNTSFFPDCKVFHKRRSSLKKFSNQIYHFGIARPILNQRHPKFKKITFWFPSIFMIFTVISVLLSFIEYWFILPLVFYCCLILIDSSYRNRSLKIGLLSLVSTFIQFFSYGSGYLLSYVKVEILNIDPKIAFPSHYC